MAQQDSHHALQTWCFLWLCRRKTDLGRFELFCLEFRLQPFSLLLNHTDCTVTSSLQVWRHQLQLKC